MRTIILLLLSVVAALCLYDISKEKMAFLPRTVGLNPSANIHHEERAYDADGKGHVVEPAMSSTQPARSNEMLTLESADGRVIRAKVLSLVGDLIKIERDDGTVYEFSTTMLTPECKKKVLAAMGMSFSRTVTLPGTDSQVDITVPSARAPVVPISESSGKTFTKAEGPIAEIGLNGATYMPGVSSLDLVDIFAKRGFDVSKERDDSVMQWNCLLSKGLVDFQLRIMTDSMRWSSVHTLDFYVNFRSVELFHKEAPELLHFVGTCALKNTDQSKLVKEWIEKNDGRNATLYLGDFRYELYSAEQSRSLTVSVR